MSLDVVLLLTVVFVAGLSAGHFVSAWFYRGIIDLNLATTRLARKNADCFSACASFLAMISGSGAVTRGDIEELRDRLRIISESSYE